MPYRFSGPALLTVLLLVAACSADNPGLPGDDQPGAPEGFVLVPAGSFTMGSPDDEPGRSVGEVPHQVTLTHPFWMQTTEVTNEQYRQLAQWALDEGLAEVAGDTIVAIFDLVGAGNFFYILTAAGSELDYDAAGDSLVLFDVGFGINPDHPIKYLSWWGAAAYCNWLSLREGRTPAYDQTTWQLDPYAVTGYRLPTEAEWEYAARAGSGTAFAGSQIQGIACESDSLQHQGWYCFNADDWARPVGSLLPNAFGLYDMHGNVWEFCNDWFNEAPYPASPDSNPTGPATGRFHIARGGTWGGPASFCRSAQRGANWPGLISAHEGMRPVLLQPQF